MNALLGVALFAAPVVLFEVAVRIIDTVWPPQGRPQVHEEDR